MTCWHLEPVLGSRQIKEHSEERPVPGCDESQQLHSGVGREWKLGPDQLPGSGVRGLGLVHGVRNYQLNCGWVDLTFGQLLSRVSSKFLLPSPYDSSSSCLTRSTSCFHQLFELFQSFVSLQSETKLLRCWQHQWHRPELKVRDGVRGC